MQVFAGRLRNGRGVMGRLHVICLTERRRTFITPCLVLFGRSLHSTYVAQQGVQRFDCMESTNLSNVSR